MVCLWVRVCKNIWLLNCGLSGLWVMCVIWFGISWVGLLVVVISLLRVMELKMCWLMKLICSGLCCGCLILSIMWVSWLCVVFLLCSSICLFILRCMISVFLFVFFGEFRV